MKLPEAQPYHPSGKEAKIIAKHVIFFAITLAGVFAAMHVLGLKTNTRIIFSTVFLVYCAAVCLCGYDIYCHEMDEEMKERKGKMSNTKKKNQQKKSDDQSDEQFALQIKRWFDGYCPKAYKLIHFIFGQDVGYENAREILHHVYAHGDSLSGIVASTYKDVNGTAVQDPKRVEDLQRRFEEFNETAHLELSFDRFFEKMPNNIKNEELTAPLPISEKNIKDIFLGNAYFECRGHLYEYDMCENSYLGPKFLFSDINNGDQVSFAFDDVMNGSILYDLVGQQ